MGAGHDDGGTRAHAAGVAPNAMLSTAEQTKQAHLFLFSTQKMLKRKSQMIKDTIAK